MRWRNGLLTAHVIASVGLLGASAGFLAVAIRLEVEDDPVTTAESLDVMRMFAAVFGVPLSGVTLATGVALGLGSGWGVFRYAWVTAKLAIVVSVMVVGALVIGPAIDDVEAGRDATASLILAGAYDVVALSAATALAVFKPGSTLRRRSLRRGGAAAGP